MVRIYDHNSQSMGHTPLVRLKRRTLGLPGQVLCKIEGRNPAYSVKCPTGAAMISDAGAKGILKPGASDVTIVEPT